MEDKHIITPNANYNDDDGNVQWAEVVDPEHQPVDDKAHRKANQNLDDSTGAQEDTSHVVAEVDPNEK